MKNINLEETTYTPRVVLDAKNHLIEFEGKCYPNNSFEFFNPITTWLEEYIETISDEKITMNMQLSYFNSSTNQILFIIFDLFAEKCPNNLTVNWFCEEKISSDYEDYEDFSCEFEDINFQLKFT